MAKANDICVVLPDPEDEDDDIDVGRIVRVVARGSDYSGPPWFDSRLHWTIVAIDGAPLSYYSDPKGPLHFGADIDCPDNCLKPIRGQRVAESERTDQPIPAEVA